MTDSSEPRIRIAESAMHANKECCGPSSRSSKVLGLHCGAFAHDGVSPCVPVPLLLGRLLHGKVANETEKQSVDVEGQRTDQRWFETARRAVFLHRYHFESEFPRRAAVHALQHSVKGDRPQEAKTRSSQCGNPIVWRVLL